MLCFFHSQLSLLLLAQVLVILANSGLNCLKLGHLVQIAALALAH